MDAALKDSLQGQTDKHQPILQSSGDFLQHHWSKHTLLCFDIYKVIWADVDYKIKLILKLLVFTSHT